MKKETTYITCDVCHSPEASELRFGLRGAEWSIDLCETDMAIFDNLMASYLAAGHKVKPAPHSVRRDGPRFTAIPVTEVPVMKRRQAS